MTCYKFYSIICLDLKKIQVEQCCRYTYDHEYILQFIQKHSSIVSNENPNLPGKNVEPDLGQLAT